MEELLLDPAMLQPDVIAPIGFAAVGAMLVLIFEILLARPAGTSGESGASTEPDSRLGVILALLSAMSIGCGVWIAIQLYNPAHYYTFNRLNPMLIMDSFAALATAIVGVGAFLCVLLSITYLRVLHIDHGEYYALLLLATAGMFVMVASVDLITVFLGLELMSIPIYALAGFDRRKLRSNEAGLKYFLIGAFASAVLLYGMALIYGATGHTDFAGIKANFDLGSPLAMMGLALFIVGFSFKVSAVPFHQWTPDVYEGAPTSVTAFMSVTVKASAFAILLRFMLYGLPGISERVHELFWILAALTMVVGNFMAVIQTNVKRMLAYSSIAHAGYILIAFAVGTTLSFGALLFYLFAYVFMNVGAFAVIVALARGGKEPESFDDFAGLAKSRPGLAGLMTLFMLALAGIPGTVGFVAKFYLFSSAVNAGYVPLAILGVFASLVSVFYYLRLPVAMYMREPEGEAPAGPSTSEWVVLLLCAGAVLWYGFFPDPGPFTDAILALQSGGRYKP